MWPFKYPYTNFHELNLDWILNEISNIPAEIRQEVAKIKTADTFKTIFDYGAKGDGCTDDTKAFEDALASDEFVFVPYGHYAVSKLVTDSKRINLIGNNAEIVFTETAGNMWRIGNSRVFLYGIKFSSTASTAGTESKILAIYASSVVICNCEFNGGDSNGLYIHDCAGINVSNCNVHDVKSGVGITVWSATKEGGRIVNNTIYNTGLDGIIPSQKGLLIAGNTIHDVGTAAPKNVGAGCIYTKDTGNGVHITNNTLYNATFAGVELNTVHDTIVEGNYIYNCGVGIGIFTSDNNIINNNTIRDCGDEVNFSDEFSGINCRADTNNNIISNNTIIQESKHKHAAVILGKNQSYFNLATGNTDALPLYLGPDTLYMENQNGFRINTHSITLKPIYDASVPFKEAAKFEKALIVPQAQSDQNNAIWSDGNNIYVCTSGGIKHIALTL